jgi:lipopolysaccharide/colanic/teichoic acid biosynthesis glycosyltransferase
VSRHPHDAHPRRASRTLDVALGAVGLVASLPLLAAAAVATRASGDRGPLLYRATRVGEGGRHVTVYKLRTMRVATVGLPITSTDDTRITRVGRVLRRLKIDELPQFLNVLRGDMSVVGPRPEDPSYVDWDDPLHRFVFSARPGITGPSQIAFRHEERLLAVSDPDRHYRTEILPQKLAMDARYLRERTARSDLAMVGATIRALFDRG